MSDFAVISALNEADTIGALVDSLLLDGIRSIVVDSASTDATADEAKYAGAMVIQLQSRPGIGPALMRGWQIALGQCASRIVQLDAGGSHNPVDALRLLSRLDNGADMIIGSRFRHGARYVNNGAWYRPHFSRLAALLCCFAQSKAWYSDWTSGYRAFTPDALRSLLKKRYTAKMHGWQIETLAHAGELGFRIAEVPITYTAGRSSFNRGVALEAVNVWFDIINHRGPATGAKVTT